MNLLFSLGFLWIFLITVAFFIGLWIGGPPMGRRWAGWVFRKGTDTICSLARLILLCLSELATAVSALFKWTRNRI